MRGGECIGEVNERGGAYAMYAREIETNQDEMCVNADRMH